MCSNEQTIGSSIDYEIKYFKPCDITRYLEQIIDMQFENTYKFHYPEKDPNIDYIRDKVLEIESHLKKDNTYFIGVIKGDNLYGYIWCYESIFIDEKRMNINSLFIGKDARGLGLGQKLMSEIKKISIDNCCDSIGTHYATFNNSAGEFYLNNGFESTRIEMVCNLKDK